MLVFFRCAVQIGPMGRIRRIGPIWTRAARTQIALGASIRLYDLFKSPADAMVLHLIDELAGTLGIAELFDDDQGMDRAGYPETEG